MTFADLLTRLNSTKSGRAPGQWTPAACEIWNEGPKAITDLVYATLVWEMGAERLARPDDEPAIRERQARIAQVVAEARARS